MSSPVPCSAQVPATSAPAPKGGRTCSSSSHGRRAPAPPALIPSDHPHHRPPGSTRRLRGFSTQGAALETTLPPFQDVEAPLGASRTVANEWAGRDTRVNAVYPMAMVMGLEDGPRPAAGDIDQSHWNRWCSSHRKRRWLPPSRSRGPNPARISLCPAKPSSP